MSASQPPMPDHLMAGCRCSGPELEKDDEKRDRYGVELHSPWCPVGRYEREQGAPMFAPFGTKGAPRGATDETLNEVVLVPLDRVGAHALLAASEVGFDGAEDAEADIDVDAGWRAKRQIERVLTGDADAELLALQAGLAAFESLMSHDPDMLVIDESDGVGLITAEEYRDLYALYAILRGGVGTPDAESLRRRVAAALDRAAGRYPSDSTLRLNGKQVEAVVHEFTKGAEDGSDSVVH